MIPNLQSAILISCNRNKVLNGLIPVLHYHAIACLHVNAGEFHPCEVVLDSHEPPLHYLLPELRNDFVSELNRSWRGHSPRMISCTASSTSRASARFGSAEAVDRGRETRSLAEALTPMGGRLYSYKVMEKKDLIALTGIKLYNRRDSPEITKLLREVAQNKRKLSREERREQKISWVYGQLPARMNVSEEEVRRILADVLD